MFDNVSNDIVETGNFIPALTANETSTISSTYFVNVARVADLCPKHSRWLKDPKGFGHVSKKKEGTQEAGTRYLFP